MSDTWWVDASHFSNIGSWAHTRLNGEDCLNGGRDRQVPPREQAASTPIPIKTAGTYRLWVRSRDFARIQPATRRFKVAVNGVESTLEFGTHRTNGLAWQNGGEYALAPGNARLDLIDSSAYYALVSRLMLTTDLGLVPSGQGAAENVPISRRLSEPDMDNVKLDADFPGGNILVDRREGDTFYLRQALRDNGQDWFYWCFRVRGATGKTLRFRFTSRDVIGPQGPGYSLDGLSWRWLGQASAEGFSHTFDGQPAYFSCALPYTEASLAAFLGRLGKQGQAIDRQTLCRSRGGRSVELLRFGQRSESARGKVFLSTRHHACEMMANYVLEGLMEEVLVGEAGAWLRNNIQFLAVPFVDKDGVEQGDQGKTRLPIDHNQDYGREPHLYPEVAAIEALLGNLQDLRALIDIHCPTLSDHRVYQWGLQDPRLWEQQKAFATLLERARPEGLPYAASNDLDSHVTNWDAAQAKRSSFRLTSWAATRFTCLVTTFEIPYAQAQGTVVDQQSARIFGHRLAIALSAWLQGAGARVPPAP